MLPLSQIKRVMKIIDSEKLEDFIKKHADANNAIEKWVEKIEAANWKNHNELKKDFLSADYVGNNRYVFNIAVIIIDSFQLLFFLQVQW